MSVATEISRLQADRNTIRAKLVELGMASSVDNLDKLAAAIEDIVNCGAVSVTVKEGETYTIPAGYHNGSGTVSGVSGGGNYSLQSKTATPTKKQQNITPDDGYYGLSDVTVAAIPEAYQDVSSVTVAESEVLVGKVFVASSGAIKTGTMANNGAVLATLSGTLVKYTIPAGYHNGSGSVKITLEEKSVRPTKTRQVITPTTGRVLSRVEVEPIPDVYITTTDATAAAGDILDGKTAYVAGEKIEGTMPIRDNTSVTLTASRTSYTIPEGYHGGSGNVSVTLETRNITPTKAVQNFMATANKLIKQVTVQAIPDNYIDTTDATATAGNILAGKTAYVNSEKLEGTMANNGDVSATIDGLTSTSATIPGGYTTGGTVSLTGDIEEALSVI